MKMRRVARWGVIGGSLLSVTVGAQQQQPAKVVGTVKTGVTAVLVDVVVRDKRGQPVHDLPQSDFEILEDGVPQAISSFTPIFESATAAIPVPAAAQPAAAPPTAAPASAKSPSAPGDPLGPPVTALVFDRLTPEGRQLAITAAKSYLGTDAKEAPHYIGVFGIDLGLKPYASFTRDADTLRKALDQVEKRASASFGIDRDKMALARREADSTASSADAAVGGAGGAGGNTQGIGSAPGAAQIAQMQQRMLTEFDVLERDQQGYTFTNGLFAIVNTLRGMKGRKSIVLFSEGVAIPPAVQRLFLGVIDAANRANVSIYTMDAAGLRTESEQAKIRDQVNQAGAAGLGRRSVAFGKADAPLSKELEKNEDVLRQDPHTGLGELAEGTGGQLFENTNNLRQGFERIESDLRNYYLLGYTPANDKYDGKFRNIEVRVKRSGVTVAARKGYFAVRDQGGAPVNTWEAPALGVVDKRPVPNAFPLRAAALSFPSSDKPGVVPVLVHLKTEPMTFTPEADQKTFKSDFAIVVRFLDPQNQVVRKVGQHYEMSGPIAELQRAKNSDIIFYREPELPPGVYTMETIVYDNPSGKGSVRYSTVEVPKAEPAKLRMSTLVLVTRAEKIDPNEAHSGPLYVNDLLVYPNLGDPVSKSAKQLAFFFTAYPGAASTDRPVAVLELIKNGAPLAQVPLELPGADATGRIQELGRLPLDAIPAGSYELRVVVKQGPEQVYRSTMFQLTE
jgi:VWFA-related protein